MSKDNKAVAGTIFTSKWIDGRICEILSVDIDNNDCIDPLVIVPVH